MRQELFAADLMARLEANSAESAKAIEKDGNTPDHVPVLKLFTPRGGCTWLLTEYDPEERKFFGLCDLGQGYPELGYVSRDEIEETAFRDNLVQIIERDEHFHAEHPLSVFTEAAMRARRIVEDTSAVEAAR
jgi:Protein of unknown function (DUF2958)